MDPSPYYVATAGAAPLFGPLAGAVSADVAVVGGGYAGLSSALELAERGYRVVLVEARSVGWGASGRNGGQVLNGLNKGPAAVEALVGRPLSRILWDFTVEATELVRQRIVRHQIPCDWRNGFVLAATRPAQQRALAEEIELVESHYDYDQMTLLDRRALADHVVGRHLVGGLYDAGCGHLHPLKYAFGLARAAAAAGVAIYDGSPVTAVVPGRRTTLRTAGGSVVADHVVLATNAEMARLRPDLARTIMPVATFVLATEVLGEPRAARLLPSDACVSDANFVLNYFRRSADHRLLFGGGAAYSGRRPLGLEKVMRVRLARTFPALATVRIDALWGGVVDITMNRLPDFGLRDGNIYYLQGFSGHGIALATMAGRLVAEAVAGTAERFDVVAGLPHRAFPGGTALRTPLLVLGMLWYRLRDLLS